MNIKHKIIIAVSLVGLAVMSRLTPHLWNMTSVGAVAILSGARLGKWWGIAVPLVVMAITDPILGLAGLPIMLVIYGSFALYGVVGFLMKETGKTRMILGGSIMGTLSFFLTTNFAVWLFGTMYPHNFFGLMASYVAGLPFLQNQIIGDLFFTTTLFLVWELGQSLAHKLNHSSKRVFVSEGNSDIAL